MDKKKILVVDDDNDIVTYLTTLLEDNGYATVAARDGVEASDRLREARPDLICLDITMPEKSGVRFYRELREAPETAGIPVVIVTGIIDEFKQFIHTRKQVPPPDGYLSKPIDEKALLELVSRLVG